MYHISSVTISDISYFFSYCPVQLAQLEMFKPKLTIFFIISESYEPMKNLF